MLKAGLFALLFLTCFASGVYPVARALAADSDAPDNCKTPTEVHFATGRISASFSDVVLRDGARCYVFSAREGQRFRAAMSGDSSSDAAVLVFKPGWGYREVHGYRMMDGDALPGAGRDDEAHDVAAVLPEGGRYLVEVATARGDAAGYTLQIQVR